MRGFLLQELLAIEVEKRGRLDREAAEAITKLQVLQSGGLVVPQLWCALIRTFLSAGVQGRPPEGVVPPQETVAGGPTGDHGAQAVSHSSEISSSRTFSCNRRRMMAPRVYQLNV